MFLQPSASRNDILNSTKLLEGNLDLPFLFSCCMFAFLSMRLASYNNNLLRMLLLSHWSLKCYIQMLLSPALFCR
jgi:hypothetical protein